MRYFIVCLIVCAGFGIAKAAPKKPEEFTSLTVQQARQGVAMFDGRDLKLSGLTSIDKDVAQELAKFKGETLSLNGLTSIDKEVAQELAKFEGWGLSLRGLTSIDKDVAQELANCNAGLSLGLTSIDKDVAQELAKIKKSSQKEKADRLIHFLNFTDLTSINKEVATELAEFQGDQISLTVKSIDKESLQEFAKLRGRFFLSLTLIDKELVRVLVKNGNRFSVRGQTSIDKEFATELARSRNSDLILRDLTSIDKDVAKELAKFKGDRLEFFGLKKIDKDVAQELAKFKGRYLSLRRLTSIDRDVAQELAKFEGRYLFLRGLTSIDKDVAQELMKYEGKLYLDGLTSINNGVLPILKSNPKISFPQKKN